MGLEIERKFCLESTQLLHRLLDEGLKPSHKHLRQVYTHVSPQETKRYRHDGQKVIKTHKKGSGLVREEIEEEVLEDEFYKALQNPVGNIIEKERYTFKLQGYEACIDCFGGTLDGLVFLEVEFPQEESAQTFHLPPFIRAQEVTNDPFYTNAMLALYGLPQSTQNAASLFAQIEQGGFNIQNIGAHMVAYDGFRVIFYHFYRLIEKYREAYLKTKENEALHQFRVNLRKTRSLLQTVHGLFDDAISKRFIDGLKQLASQTNTKRDLDVFEEYLTYESAKVHLCPHINQSKSNEDDALSILLASPETIAFLSEWKMVLEDEEGFFGGKNASIPFKALGALSLKRQFEALSTRIKRLNESASLSRFHKVRIEFKRLRYLLEVCEHLFSSKPLTKAVKKAKIMQELFGTLQDRDIQSSVLKSFESEPTIGEDLEAVAAIEALLVQISHEIYGLRTQILCNKRKLLKRFKKCIPVLEPYQF
jgi:CHAD domain-containing protein/CYTH domain-containing protein